MEGWNGVEEGRGAGCGWVRCGGLVGMSAGVGWSGGWVGVARLDVVGVVWGGRGIGEGMEGWGREG